MLSAINAAILNNKQLAYNFVENSGLNDTAEKTGHTTQTLFGFNGDLAFGIGMIINTALSLLGVVFLGLIIYGGIMWMTAEGAEERVEKAKGIITNSIIGLVIVLAAYAISYFIISALAK
ncbi:MAG: hypothetical protein PHO56_03045 [Patescibacteria group bacterium]|nr:hypothetical protein [Patescibacteria group bacterium]